MRLNSPIGCSWLHVLHILASCGCWWRFEVIVTIIGALLQYETLESVYRCCSWHTWWSWAEGIGEAGWAAPAPPSYHPWPPCDCRSPSITTMLGIYHFYHYQHQCIIFLLSYFWHLVHWLKYWNHKLRENEINQEIWWPPNSFLGLSKKRDKNGKYLVKSWYSPLNEEYIKFLFSFFLVITW